MLGTQNGAESMQELQDVLSSCCKWWVLFFLLQD